MIYIGVIGGRNCKQDILKKAYRVGVAIAEFGAILVCGGMGGVMESACRGAIEKGGVTIGLLPMKSRIGANPYLTYSIPTGLLEARNQIVVNSSNGLIALDGSYGTLSEIAFALMNDKPLVGINTWELRSGVGDIPPIDYTDVPEDAVNILLNKITKEM